VEPAAADPWGAAAQSPLDALDLDAAPAFRTPPDLPKPMLSWGSWTP
jgi:hypothetical protein